MQIAPAVYKLRKTIKNLLQPEAHYLLAVSGGADSLALAHACAALAAQGWGSYSVCHVEHGLRGEEALRDMLCGTEPAFYRRCCAPPALCGA